MHSILLHALRRRPHWQVREVGGDGVREGIHVDATNEEELSGRWGGSSGAPRPALPSPPG